MRSKRWPLAVGVSVFLAACLHDYDRFELDAAGGSAGVSTGGNNVGGGNAGGGGAGGSDTPAGNPTALAGEGGQDTGGGGAISEPSAGAPAMCESGTTRCDAACADLNEDPNHCGSCDVACSPQHVAVLRCQAGSCAPV